MIEASFLFLPLFSDSFTALNLIVAFFPALQIYVVQPLNLIAATRGQDRCGSFACDRIELESIAGITKVAQTFFCCICHKKAKIVDGRVDEGRVAQYSRKAVSKF